LSSVYATFKNSVRVFVKKKQESSPLQVPAGNAAVIAVYVVNNTKPISNVYYRKMQISLILKQLKCEEDRHCGLVVRVPGYRSRGPGSILGATRFSEK
jgi:hypothetical protein